MTRRDGVSFYPEGDRVVSGRRGIDPLIGEIGRRWARRAFVIASNSRARASGVLEALRGKLRDRLAGSWTRIGAHTPRPDVVAAASAAAQADADLIVTIGAGAVRVAGKFLRLCLAYGIGDARELGRLPTRILSHGQ